MPRFLPPLAMAALLILPVSAAAEDLKHQIAKVGDLVIEKPWLRANLPDRPTAAYLEITNSGSSDDRLLAVSSERFETIELHMMALEDGVMNMKMVNEIALPAGETTSLEPGGFHLMLFGATEAMEEGTTVKLTLTFETAGELDLVVPVAKRGAPALHHNHQTSD